MNDKDRKMVGVSWIKMYDSLLDAVNNAGGDPCGFTIKYLEKSSVIDLFNSLATNHVRFYCTKTHSLVEKTTQSIQPGIVIGSD